MKSIKSLLVPVDHSEISVASYHYALRLAEKLSASVHLLHCIPAVGAVAGHGHMVFDLTVKLQQEAEARLQEFMEAGLEKLRPELEQLVPPAVGQLVVHHRVHGVRAFYCRSYAAPL